MFISRTPESYVISCFFQRSELDLCVVFGCIWLISAERIEGKVDFASFFPCALTSKSDVNQHVQADIYADIEAAFQAPANHVFTSTL